jgi:NitT/TauT family transport system permease protein
LNRRGARRALVVAAQLTVVALVLVTWQLIAGDPRKGTGLIDEFFSGRPTKILDQLVIWVQSGIVFTAAWVTLQEAVIGFVIGSLLGMVFGFGLGASRPLALVFAPLFYSAYSVPRLALVPMFILWFGIGMQSKIAMVSLLVFFLTFFNSFQGAHEVDEELIATTRMMGASRWQVLWKVTLPSALAWVSLGLQISVPHAFTGAIVAEIVGGNEGLGQLIQRSANQFNPNGLFAGVIVAVVLSSIVNAIVAAASAYFLRWRTSDEHSAGMAAQP